MATRERGRLIKYKDILKIVRAKNAGIRRPVLAWEEAARVGVPYYVLCAYLVQESAGGYNIFGHDDSIYRGAGIVTKDKYLAYKKERDRLVTRRMQGVGPMQLTWWEFQDRADIYGGCWVPKYNVRVGAELLVKYHEEHTWHDVARLYNAGSLEGDRGQEYARRNGELRVKWMDIVRGEI